MAIVCYILQSVAQEVSNPVAHGLAFNAKSMNHIKVGINERQN